MAKRKEKRGPRKIIGGLSKGKCRLCNREEIVDRWGWMRAASPRCSSCGGVLDKLKYDRVLEAKRKTGRKGQQINREIKQNEQLHAAQCEGQHRA